MGASERQIFFKVSLPAASPWIVSALKVGVPFSLIGAIIGEVMAASRGLGYMIQLNTNQFDTTGAVSGILVLMMPATEQGEIRRRGGATLGQSRM